MNPSEALKFYFNYNTFRPGQEDIISAITAGENVIAVLPTGGGKSICYQVPALITEKFSIVISPLIALMKDQVDALNKSGKIAAYINSSLSYAETEQVFRELNDGNYKILYLAPERLESLTFAQRIKNLSPSFLFVDEAHCISEWGHNFRPSYRKIKEFAEYISLKKIAAFTATATPEVIKDISDQLGLENPKIFVKGFERENLYINVRKAKNKKEECLHLINTYGTPAIIYTSSRKAAEETAGFLNLYGLNCSFYHAGMESVQRKLIQEDFLKDKIKIITATNAFGMGIDKSDIRLIIHYNMPGTIENYYQEIGRAGRDGKESYAVLLFEGSDKHIHKYFIENSYPNEPTIISIYNAICDFEKIAVGNTTEKEIPVDRQYINAYLKQDISKAKIAAAINILEQAGYIKPVSDFYKKHTVQFSIDAESLKRYLKTTTNYIVKEIIVLLLRKYGNSILSYKTNISPDNLAQEFGASVEYIEDILLQLNSTGILEYNKPIMQQSVKFAKPRIESSRILLDAKKIEANYHHALNKLDYMVEYINSDVCRMKFIIDYFASSQTQDNYSCGKCDNCDQQKELFEFDIDGTLKNPPTPFAKGGAPADSLPENYETNLELFNKLREARIEASQKFQQPAYLICSDEILRRVADEGPVNPQALLSTKGFTQKMFNKVGANFLQIINEHKTSTATESKDIPKSVSETYQLLKKGYDLNNISALRKLTPAVISMQIETILEYDNAIDVSCVIGTKEYELIKKEINEGFLDLRDLKSRLPAEINFPMIRIAVAKEKVKK